MRSVWLVGVGLVLGAVAACSGKSQLPVGGGSGGGSGAGAGSGTGVGTGGGSGGAEPPPAFTVSGSLGDGAGNGVAGASVCLLASPTTCVTTDGSGNYSIDGVTASGSGILGTATSAFLPMAWPLSPINDLSYSGFFRTVANVSAYATETSAAFDASHGAIVFHLYDASGNPLAGAKIACDRGGTVGYFKDDGSGVDPTLTTTSTAGDGYIFGVPPGTVNLTVTATGLACAPAGREAWLPSAAGASASAPAIAGTLTVVRISCQ